MKVLMIGLGSIGQRHLRNLVRKFGDDLEVIAYRVRGLQRTFSDEMKIRKDVELDYEFSIKVFSDLEEALLEKPKVAFITNITKSHIPCAIACAKAGCHLFLEKPVSDSLEGVDELLSLEKEKNIKIFVGYQNRFHPGIQTLKMILNQNELGQILAVRSIVGERLTTMHTYEDYQDTYMARKDMGGGVLLNQMVHELDYLYYLFGKPKSVYALGGTDGNLDIDVEDNIEAIYKTEYLKREIAISVHADFYQSPPQRSVRVVGENGWVKVDLTKAKVTKVVHDVLEEISFEEFERNQMFEEELNLFFECIMQDQKPEITLEDGIVSLKMALAARKSIRTKEVAHEFNF